MYYETNRGSNRNSAGQKKWRMEKKVDQKTKQKKSLDNL